MSASTAAELDVRATAVYADFMGHLYGCRPCQGGDYCTRGTRMRAAWKAARNISLRAHRASRTPPWRT
ncbi:hypothetical protein GCM10010252_22750 [Streptomyces aureoverticillatus]|nr:hypothetical protein GCM10010252_22750 [Streptomyces aureoverticillatus]